MVQTPPPPYWPPSRTATWQSPGTVIGVIMAIVVGLIAAGILLSAFTSISMSPFGGFAPLFFLPFCGVFIVIVLVIALAASGGLRGRTLPPPPPIQQPMVPAGLQGSVALACPNCGAPPQNVDRFGVATCPYCNTRFLVR